MAFFSSPPDWIIIFIVALIVFGPKKLPEVGQQLGKALREFRKVADEITGATKSVHDEISSATGRFRSGVEITPPVLLDSGRIDKSALTTGMDRPEGEQRNLMAKASQLETGAPIQAEPSEGLKLSTLPDVGEQTPKAKG